VAGARELTGISSRMFATPKGWRVLAAFEVAVATVAVLADWFIPALVLVAMAAVSLLVRRRGPSSLGFHSTARPWRLGAQMLAFATAWTLLNVALLIPVSNHLSGRRQDVSGFSDLQGNLGLLVVYLVLAWVLAAFCEETAFRGYLLTRLTDVLGNGRAGIAVSVTISSILFGLLHTEQGVVGVMVSAVAGAVFAALRYRFRTLWAPVLAHGFDDTIGFTWFYLFGPGVGLW
jgi:membrane protease YdiL (CAAX protease family)